MKYKVAILNTEFMDACVKAALEPLFDKCEFTTFYYKESGEIPEIYNRVEEEFDGFLVNGLISTAILKRACPEQKKPIEAIHMDLLSYYRGLLKLSVSFPKADLDRTCVDFLEDGSLVKRIKDGTIDFVAEHYCTEIENMSLEELLEQKHRLIERVKKCREEGKLDLVVTRFSTVMEEFKREQIPCYFIFPGKTYILEVAGRLLMRLDMERMRDSFPAVIRISCWKNTEGYDEFADLDLRRALLEFGRNSGGDFVVQKRDSYFEVFTSAGTLARITGAGSGCMLKPCLEHALGRRVCIGYGIGKNAVQARQAALDACRESELNPAGASFMMDEQERLTGPLAYGKRLVLEARPSGEQLLIAEQTGISPLTLQKIYAVSEAEEGGIITARLLAGKLGLTVRAASKYLQKLVQGGAAWVVGTRQRKTRGRPELLVQVQKPSVGVTGIKKNDRETEEMK